MDYQTVSSLTCLLLPPAFLAFRRIRDQGFAIPEFSLLSLQSGLALALLSYVVFTTVPTGAGELLDSGFPVARRFLPFLVSGVAFAVALFPRQAADLSALSDRLPESRLEWLFVLPAWLWIVVWFFVVET